MTLTNILLQVFSRTCLLVSFRGIWKSGIAGLLGRYVVNYFADGQHFRSGGIILYSRQYEGSEDSVCSPSMNTGHGQVFVRLFLLLSWWSDTGISYQFYLASS